jgi:hypothetical protein
MTFVPSFSRGFAGAVRAIGHVSGRDYLSRLGRKTELPLSPMDGPRLAELDRLMAEGERLTKAKPIRRGSEGQRCSSMDVIHQRHEQLKRDLARYDPTWATALHESGHATAAVVFELPSLSIARNIQSGNELGSVRFTSSLADAQQSSVIAMVFAGPFAERRWNGLDLESVALNDVDAAIVVNALRRAPAWVDSTRKYLADSIDKARAIINDRWPAVLAVAKELVVKKFLGKEEIEQIVSNN